MAHPIEEKTDRTMNNRCNILNGSNVYNLRVTNDCAVKPVKVNVIIRDETSEIAMMWKTTIRDKRNYALCWNKKGKETMTNNLTCNQTIIVPSYPSY
jgi:hypothetical protein